MDMARRDGEITCEEMVKIYFLEEMRMETAGKSLEKRLWEPLVKW